MNDQGEKIVFLAREILNAGAIDTVRPQMRVTMSFKTLCLTTFLAAAGGGLSAGWVHATERPLNRYERTELEALVFYASKLKGIDADMLRQEVERQAGVMRFDDLSAGDFPAARRYLQEKAQ